MAEAKKDSVHVVPKKSVEVPIPKRGSIRRGRVVPQFKDPVIQARVLKSMQDAQLRATRYSWQEKDGDADFTLTTPGDKKNKDQSEDTLDSTLPDPEFAKKQQALRRRQNYVSLSEAESFGTYEKKLIAKEATKSKTGGRGEAEKENVKSSDNSTYSESFIKREMARRRRKNYVSLTDDIEADLEQPKVAGLEVARRRPTDVCLENYSAILQGADNETGSTVHGGRSKMSIAGKSRDSSSDKSQGTSLPKDLVVLASDGQEISPIVVYRRKSNARRGSLDNDDISENLKGIIGLNAAREDYKKMVTSTPLAAPATVAILDISVNPITGEAINDQTAEANNVSKSRHVCEATKATAKKLDELPEPEEEASEEEDEKSSDSFTLLEEGDEETINLTPLASPRTLALEALFNPADETELENDVPDIGNGLDKGNDMPRRSQRPRKPKKACYICGE